MGRKATSGGVEPRDCSIRIRFTWRGKRHAEVLTVNGQVVPPSAANLKLAHRVSAEVQRRLSLGTFDLAEFFPESPRVAHAAAEGPATFGATADDWYASKGQLTEATRDQYATSLRLWKRLLGADVPMAGITYQTLAKVVGRHPWASGKSANNHLSVLRGVFEFFYAGPLAAQNPITGIQSLPTVRKKPDPLSRDERDLVLADMAERYDVRVWAYFTFCFFTGMRPEEVIALRWGDIDFRSAIAHVCRVRTFKGSEREGSKTHAERDVDLLDEALAALQAMKPYTFMKGADADIFEHPVLGRPWHDERSQRDTYWKPCLRRLGLRQRRAYCTRHTYATVALMGGVKPGYVAAQMGHSSTRMFFETYARWINDADKGVNRQAMAAAFASDSAHVRPAALFPVSKPLINNGETGRRDWTRTNPGGDCRGQEGGDANGTDG